MAQVFAENPANQQDMTLSEKQAPEDRHNWGRIGLNGGKYGWGAKRSFFVESEDEQEQATGQPRVGCVSEGLCCEYDLDELRDRRD